MENKLDDIVESMRVTAENLVPYTFPVADYETEQAVSCFKQRIIKVDGYDVMVCLTRAQHADYSLDTLQFRSYHTPYLPFNMVCKLGKIFLGPSKLLYIEFIKDGKKVYCWTSKTVDGEPSDVTDKSLVMNFEDFEFKVLAGSQIKNQT